MGKQKTIAKPNNKIRHRKMFRSVATLVGESPRQPGKIPLAFQEQINSNIRLVEQQEEYTRQEKALERSRAKIRVANRNFCKKQAKFGVIRPRMVREVVP